MEYYFNLDAKTSNYGPNCNSTMMIFHKTDFSHINPGVGDYNLEQITLK